MAALVFRVKMIQLFASKHILSLIILINSIYNLQWNRCPNDFEDIRCSKKSSKIPTEYLARKSLFYAISITIIICLIAIGAYYSLQKGYLDRILPSNLRSKLNNLNNSSNNIEENDTSTRSNIQFNKLIEDEVIDTEV